MAKKRSKKRKNLYMQKAKKTQQPKINPATGLRDDEIAFSLDPDNRDAINSYLLPDGQYRTGKDTPKGIPSIIHPDLIFADKTQPTPRATLASRLGEMLLIAERLFGKRDRHYTFLGFEFTNDLPQIHFEGEGNQYMVMRLSQGALLEPMNAYAEMAHECIHMLSPVRKKPVNILEEGIAEFFMFTYMRDTMNHILKTKPIDSPYGEAAYLVSLLMRINPYGIREMREEEPSISLISKSLIWKHYPMLEEGMAARLSRTFLRDGWEESGRGKWYERENILFSLLQP